MQANIRKLQDKFPSVDLSVHYDKMARLLELSGKSNVESEAVERMLGTSTAGEVLQQAADDDDVAVSPDRDVRALQYDACSEYFMFRKL